MSNQVEVVRSADPSEFVELITLSPFFKLDIRYARTDNVFGQPYYKQARAFLQKPAARSLVDALHELLPLGYGLVIFDGYRPWSITVEFWNSVTEEQKEFVADPREGSKHNRGCAVDLSLYFLSSGLIAEMPSEFDEMSERSSASYEGGSTECRARRDLLIAVMERNSFTVESNEWWHFNWVGWESFSVYDISFDEISPLSGDRI
jgi:zinc D-Ala-D-Ala dipeptidase